MTLVHTAAHSVNVPDRFEDDETGNGFEVSQDTSAEDPRTWIPDEHSAVYVYNGPRGHKDSEIPENIVVQAFARFNDALPSDDHAFAATLRWMNAYLPDQKFDVAIQTIRGYSQGDWMDVIAASAEGYGTAQSHIDEFRMWSYGDVWDVDPDNGDALSGIYADDAEAALQHFLADRPQSAESDAPSVETSIVPDPAFSRPGLTRWHVDDGTVVADAGKVKPGVHFYPRDRDNKLVTNPVQLAATLCAANILVTQNQQFASEADTGKDGS